MVRNMKEKHQDDILEQILHNQLEIMGWYATRILDRI